MVFGFVGRIRDGTVTGMLQTAGLAGEWHHGRAHDFFARARWNPDDLGGNARSATLVKPRSTTSRFASA